MITEGDSFRDKPVNIPSKGKASLKIMTLGGLSIHRDGKPVPALHSRKAQALLVYLAVTTRPQPREVLADLLWEEFSQKKAMNNLRVVLSNLRKHLGDHLLITRDTAAMNPGVDYDLDMAVLDGNLGYAAEIERKTGTLDRDAVTRIEQGIELYKGEFLQGFFVEGAAEFDAWMVVEREHLHHIVLDGLGKLVRWKLGQDAYTDGIRHASKWVQLDPLSETAHRQMMRLLAFSGQRSAALAQYERCRQIFADELGLEPDTKTTALYEQIRKGELAPDETISQLIPPPEPGKPDIRRHNLPVQTTTFIGRDRELAELDKLLRDSDVRLVTVMGAGGMGKTRLALQAGEGLLDQFSDGVFFVSLTRLKSEDLIVPSMIQALGIEFAGGGGAGGAESPTYLKEILLRNLRRKQMLLILDNFEHLLDGANLVGEMIQTAPGVKVLATSRARLNIDGEHRFQVGGMAYPEETEDQSAQNFSAVRLFLESARRARSTFEFHPDEMKHIVNICRLVEGMPLGIRLAAAWVETLSPEEITVEITQNLDLLETDLRDIPERHRSIRALFEHSWRLLSARERGVFNGFSVFRGGCSREAAQDITRAMLRDLRSLVDKSLLQRALNGRYETHELAREYAAEKLEENLESKESVHSRHSAYYNTAVEKWGDDLKSTRHISALKEMDLEIDNARAAWNWAVERRRADLLDMSMEGFWHYYAIRKREKDAEKAFCQAAERIKSLTPGDELRVYARLLCLQGYFSEGIEQKKELYHQSLSILEQLEEGGQDVRFDKALVLYFSGCAVTTSDFDKAIQIHNDSLRIFKNLNNSYWIAVVINEIGRKNFLNGHLDEAQKSYEWSFAIFHKLGDPRSIAITLGRLDYVARRRGKFEEAERLARERLEIYKIIGDNSAIADGSSDYGVALLVLGNFEEAHAHLEGSSSIHKEMEDFERYLEDTFNLCWAKIDLGWYMQAVDELKSAMDWCRGRVDEVSDTKITGQALSIQGAASLALGRLAEAEQSLQASISAFQKTYTITVSVHPYSYSGILHILMGQVDRAREYLRSALKMGVEINSAMALIIALTGVPLFLAGEGHLEHAVEISALALRYPWNANSQWYQDVIEGPLSIRTASLSPDAIAAAKKRGRERDLEETVQELLAELA